MSGPGSQFGLLSRAIGHGFGIVGAVFALDAVATTVNPHLARLFPFPADGIGQEAAAVVAVALIVAAMWLVWVQDYRRRKTLAALSRTRPTVRNPLDKDAER